MKSYAASNSVRNGQRNRAGRRWLWLGLAAYVALFFWLAYRKYACFTNDSGDAALFVNTFWGTIHGKFFWNYIVGMSYFGDHTGFILPLFVPVYWLAPYPATLLLLQTCLIALAGIPVFLIARRVWSDTFAAGAVTAAFLFFPTIASQHVNQIHDTQFTLAFPLFAFYFFETGNFRLFVTFLLLSCLGKENIPLTLFMFGVYAWWLRRPWKWVVTPMVISATVMALMFKVVMPYFRRGHPYRSFGYFGSLGETPWQVLTSVVTNPALFLSALFSQQNVMYLIQLVQPVGWVLPFLSLPVIFALPDLLVNLLAENVSLKVIRWHYNLTVGSFLFVGAIYSVRKVGNWLSARYGPARYSAGFGVLLLCLSLSSWTLWLDVNDYRRPPQYAALREALSLVPPGVSVLAPQPALVHVANRWQFASLSHVLITERDPEKLFKYKFVILDANERRPPWNVPPEVVNAYSTNPNYELIFNQQNVLVFRRRGEDPLPPAPPSVKPAAS